MKKLQQIQFELEALACQIIPDLDTLETQNSDDLDFKDLAVWNIRDLMLAAYNAGANDSGGSAVSSPEAAIRAALSGIGTVQNTCINVTRAGSATGVALVFTDQTSPDGVTKRWVVYRVTYCASDKAVTFIRHDCNSSFERSLSAFNRLTEAA